MLGTREGLQRHRHELGWRTFSIWKLCATRFLDALCIDYAASLHAMSPLLQIRNVPDDARRALKARAASRGESLNTYLLDLIERDVARPTVEEVLDRAVQRADRASASAVELIDEAREERGGELPRRPT